MTLGATAAAAAAATALNCLQQHHHDMATDLQDFDLVVSILRLLSSLVL